MREGRTDGKVTAAPPAPELPGDERSEDSESKDWSPPNPESSSNTNDCDEGGGGRDTLDDPRPFFAPTPEDAVSRGEWK